MERKVDNLDQTTTQVFKVVFERLDNLEEVIFNQKKRKEDRFKGATMSGDSFDLFLLYLEQVFSHEILCPDECHRKVQELIEREPDYVLELYNRYLFQLNEHFYDSTVANIAVR